MQILWGTEKSVLFMNKWINTVDLIFFFLLYSKASQQLQQNRYLALLFNFLILFAKENVIQL